jgi:hypothetical protein
MTVLENIIQSVGYTNKKLQNCFGKMAYNKTAITVNINPKPCALGGKVRPCGYCINLEE